MTTSLTLSNDIIVSNASGDLYVREYLFSPSFDFSLMNKSEPIMDISRINIEIDWPTSPSILAR